VRRRAGAHWWWGEGGIASPAQHLSILVYRQPVDGDDFVLQVLEVRLIQSKLPLEGPIRDSPAVLEHRNGLVQDLVKGHA